MQIVVNTRLLLKDRLEGIGWFTQQTLSRITRQNPDVHFVFLFDRDFDEDFIFSDNITPLIIGPQARHPFLYYAWFEYSVKSVLDRLKPDLFVSPDGFLSLRSGCPQLPVIHDINFLHHPSDSKWLTGKYYNYYFPRYARKAKRIATVSEFSKKDISKSYDIPAGKIDVVYNGINPEFRQLTVSEKNAVREKYSQGKPYFVSVGSIHPRKNIPNLIAAYNQFRISGSDQYKLVIAGPPFWGTASVEDAFKNSPFRNDIIFTGRLSSEDLALVMGAASALTLVSYYEGFGIPLVEAMAAEVPVICSNTTSLPEIAGPAALTVDPHEIGQISEAMKKISSNPALVIDLVEKGRQRKKEFSWDKSAGLLWESIQKAIAS